MSDFIKQQAQIAKAVEWLRAHADKSAQLHADSRSLKPGDVFFAYAVDGADSRPHIDAAFEKGAAAVLYQPENFAGYQLAIMAQFIQCATKRFDFYRQFVYGFHEV